MNLSFYMLSVVLAIVPSIQSLRILGLFNHPGESHFRFFHPLLRELALKGHNITVVSYFPDKNPVENYTDLVLTGMPALKDFIDLKNFESSSSFSIRASTFFLIHNWGLESCEASLKSDAIKHVLKLKEKFDVILLEQFNNDCMSGVAYLLKAPVIAISSCALLPWHYSRMGSPFIQSYMPVVFLDHSENMGYIKRIKNLFYDHLMNFLYNYLTQKQTNKILRKHFGDSNLDIEEIVLDTSIMFINQHYSLTGVKPWAPSVIELGGMHIQKPKELPKEIQHILDSAKQGVIYISWGSLIRAESLPNNKREAIVKAIGRLEQVVLWKWENETLPNQPKNVFIRKWMPQREILCHPNVKVFLSHGGLLGTTEAAHCGVPIVVTPILGDQFLNAAAVVHRGMGTILEYNEINEETVYESIQNALSSRSLENARKVSYTFNNRPNDPMNTAIWWVEHVAATKGLPLTKSIASDLPWYIYHSIDVYVGFIFLVMVSFLVLKKIFELFCFKKIVTSKIKEN